MARFKLFVHQLSLGRAESLSPIFVVLAGVAELFPAPAAAPRPLPPAMSNYPVSPPWSLQVRRSELIRSTTEFPIPDRAVAPVTVPESGQAFDVRRSSPRAIDRQHFRR